MRKRVFSFVMLFMLGLLALMPQKALADDSCSISIDFSVESHTIGVNGGVFSLIKICDYEDGYYTSCNTIKDIDLERLENDTEDYAVEVAKKASDKDAVSETTDQNGQCAFSNLSEGLWLIKETARTKDAESYDWALPTLVSLPKWEDGNLTRQVTIYPKTTPIKPEPETEPVKPSKPSAPETPTAKTGDTVNVTFWEFIAGFSASLTFGLIAVALIKRKKNDNE